MRQRPELDALARRLGVLFEYTDYRGQRRVTSDDAKVAVIAGLGYDAGTEEAAANALQCIDADAARHMIDPVRVVRASQAAEITFALNLPADARPSAWQVELGDESGEARCWQGAFAADQPPIIQANLGELELGAYRVTVRLESGAGEVAAQQRLFVVPAACLAWRRLIPGGHAFGVYANLYTIPRADNFGVGDLRDLGALCGWAGQFGAAFVGINPLHALHNSEDDISPYGPITRLFGNPLYLDLRAVPELEQCPAARQLLDSTGFSEGAVDGGSGHVIDYDSAWRRKLRVLRLLYDAFASRRSQPCARSEAYQRYCHIQGEILRNYAVFMALDERFGAAGGHDWRQWPAEFRDPRSAAVADFAAAHARQVDFWCYLQFELDRQLADVASRSAAGMPIGLYQDLALGSAAGGADTWGYPALFAQGVSVGAPPDDYSEHGQQWGFPPVNPHALRASGYVYWQRVLQAALRHSGALRIDHVMGLFRQFWVSHGAAEGAYVAYPADDLLGILALESHRHGAVVIGENLGTVPAGLTERLHDNNVLSCAVLFFEREDDGAFRAARAYHAGSFASATTHDHPPLRGYWSMRDLDIRRACGQIATDAALAEARDERQRTKQALVHRLIEEGLLPDASAADDDARLCEAVHAFLSSTPCALVAVMLDDVAGETEPVNIPGVGRDRYPVWSRRMARPLSELQRDALVNRVLADMSRRRGAPSAR